MIDSIIFFCFFTCSFSVFTLLDRRQLGHLAYKNGSDDVLVWFFCLVPGANYLYMYQLMPLPLPHLLLY